MHLTLNMCLILCICITNGTLILIRLHKKAVLLNAKVKSTEDRKVHVDENKNAHHRPSDLDSGSIIVVRQKGKQN